MRLIILERLLLLRLIFMQDFLRSSSFDTYDTKVYT